VTSLVPAPRPATMYAAFGHTRAPDVSHTMLLAFTAANVSIGLPPAHSQKREVAEASVQEEANVRFVKRVLADAEDAWHQVIEVGMATEATCASKPLTIM
jgi:hypothetical protein